MTFLFMDTEPTRFYTLSLHDALPISGRGGARRGQAKGRGGHRRPEEGRRGARGGAAVRAAGGARARRGQEAGGSGEDRKSTRLNSSHPSISYAVFCLKKKNEQCHLRQ